MFTYDGGGQNENGRDVTARSGLVVEPALWGSPRREMNFYRVTQLNRA